MKFSYRLARLCGSVHDGANVVFATTAGPAGGDELLFSAVGNRISVFELTQHSSYTLPVECRSDVARLAVNHASSQLLAIDREGRAVVVNVARRIALHRFNFKGPVRDVKYSPDDRWIAVALGARLQIWAAPGHRHDLTPFVLHNTLAGHSDDITCIDWTQDSRSVSSKREGGERPGEGRKDGREGKRREIGSQ
jgi:periodic tryptophan protein 2